MSTDTNALICTGTIIRAQGTGAEAWYNGVRDAELDRLQRQHAEKEAQWEKERKALTELMRSAEREARRARRSSYDRLEARVRKDRRRLRRQKLANLPWVIVGAVIVWGLRTGLLQMVPDDGNHDQP